MLIHYIFYSGIVIGSGLCIFSRYPIVSVIAHEYSVSGGIKIFYDGEVFAGKGVLCCRVLTPCGIVAVFNTHVNPRCRSSQLFQLMQFIHNIRHRDPVIVCGDFNTKDTNLEYQLMAKCLGLQDLFIDDPVDTCDIKSNVFTKDRHKPKRIDFIFYSDEFCSNQQLTSKSKRLAFTGNIPGKDFPCSDHEGVEGVFVLTGECQDMTKWRMKEESLKVLSTLSDDINKTLHPMIKKWKSIKHSLMFLVIVVVIGIFCCVLLSSQALHLYLASYSVHWLTGLICGVIGALLAILFFLILNEFRLVAGLQANIDEINTVLRYHDNTKQE